MGTFRTQNLSSFFWMFLASIWSTGCEPNPSSSPESCGIPPSTNEECEVLTCAAQDECVSLAEAIDCCIEQYGYGLEQERALLSLAEDCSGEDCDPDNHISAKTALCIAQAHGLESGVGWCGGAFLNSNPDFHWSVINTVEERECTEENPYGHTFGYLVKIDSKTGKFIDTGNTEIYGIIDCSGGA